MGHQESYQHNEAYAEFLSGWDIHFYSKYIDTLAAGASSRPGASASDGRVLDVGCGVGQVADPDIIFLLELFLQIAGAVAKDCE